MASTFQPRLERPAPMSRLDSFIRRLEAQRACLDMVMAALGPGIVLELGLGNGRTYDHLREHLPERRILVFERLPNPQARPMPAAEDLLVGPLQDSLPALSPTIRGGVALIHSDIGCGDPAIDARMAALIGTEASDILAPGGWLLSDQEIGGTELLPQPLPKGIPASRYYIYRKAIAT